MSLIKHERLLMLAKNPIVNSILAINPIVNTILAMIPMWSSCSLPDFGDKPNCQPESPNFCISRLLRAIAKIESPDFCVSQLSRAVTKIESPHFCDTQLSRAIAEIERPSPKWRLGFGNPLCNRALLGSFLSIIESITENERQSPKSRLTISVILDYRELSQ